MSDKINCEFLPNDYSYYDISFKIMFIGEVAGKSCLLQKVTTGEFPDIFPTTVGFEFYTIYINIDDVINKLQIWDTCSGEVHGSLMSSFYRNCDLVMIVYAIDSKESFNRVDYYLHEAKSQSKKNCHYFLIGNKKDLEYERQVSKEEGEKFAKENKFDFFIETSAKTGENLKVIFIEAAKILYLSHKKEIKEKINDKLMKYISF